MPHGLVTRRSVVALLLGCTINGLTLEGRQIPGPGVPARPPSVEPFPSKGTVISEVLFAPQSGAPFVEIFNSGTTAVEVGTTVLRIGEQDFALGHVTEPLAPGARLLVVFDGVGRAEKGVLHAPKGISLPADSGVLLLRDYKDDPIDRVAWGDQPAAVPFGSGFAGDEVPRGSTIGRPPTANRPSVFTEWVVYAPTEATPGAANPVPGVTVFDLAPISGTIFTESSVNLSWFPATGVSRYRVQIGTDRSFAAPQVDRVVEETSLEVRLDPARYVWRVQSVGADNAAPFSPPSSFRVQPEARTAGLLRGTRGWLVETLGLGAARGRSTLLSASASLAMAAVAPAQASNRLPPENQPVRLAVPLLLQHKDSRMLQLENRNRIGPHAWDQAHSTSGSTTDLADTWNCALANVAMVNRFFGGNLTQDRIGYEMLSRNVVNYRGLFSLPNGAIDPAAAGLLREVAPGPEWDLSFGNGINGARIVAALAYALNGLPRYHLRMGSLDEIWKLVTTEISAKRPVITGFGNHTYTVYGYQLFPDGTRLIFLNDPLWDQRQRVAVLDDTDEGIWSNLRWWLMPIGAQGQRQEPGVTADSDDDGVFDFDETERFMTDPRDNDSDDDGVGDLQDIASSVFEAEHTYGYGTTHVVGGPGRDFDQDGIPPERDPDSDDGGCKDGEEDRNNSGMHDPNETGNFDDIDDRCNGVDGIIKYTTVITTDVSDGGRTVRVFASATGRITLRLKRDPDQKRAAAGQLVDNGSTFRVVSTGQMVVAPTPDCTIYGRESMAGSGTFNDPGAEIGAVRSRDILTVGANGETSGFTFANLCGQIGGNPANGSWALPECDGLLDGTAPGAYVFSCWEPAVTLPNIRVLVWSVDGRVRLR